MILTDDEIITKIWKNLSYLVIKIQCYLMQYEWTCYNM